MALTRPKQKRSKPLAVYYSLIVRNFSPPKKEKNHTNDLWPKKDTYRIFWPLKGCFLNGLVVLLCFVRVTVPHCLECKKTLLCIQSTFKPFFSAAAVKDWENGKIGKVLLIIWYSNMNIHNKSELFFCSRQRSLFM